MLSCDSHRLELAERLQVVTSILDATHADSLADDGPRKDISREARGLCIVLLYAAYENLLVSLCRSILETTIDLGIENKRLKPSLQVFAIYSRLQAVTSAKPTHIWNRLGSEVVELLTHSTACTISADIFPDDGSHMRRSQVATFCRVFGLTDPGPILREAWERIDSIVSERNGVAHGRLKPGEVGRNYSVQELRQLTEVWLARWTDFLDWVESATSKPGFFDSGAVVATQIAALAKSGESRRDK